MFSVRVQLPGCQAAEMASPTSLFSYAHSSWGGFGPFDVHLSKSSGVPEAPELLQGVGAVVGSTGHGSHGAGVQ